MFVRPAAMRQNISMESFPVRLRRDPTNEPGEPNHGQHNVEKAPHGKKEGQTDHGKPNITASPIIQADQNSQSDCGQTYDHHEFGKRELVSDHDSILPASGLNSRPANREERI